MGKHSQPEQTASCSVCGQQISYPADAQVPNHPVCKDCQKILLTACARGAMQRLSLVKIRTRRKNGTYGVQGGHEGKCDVTRTHPPFRLTVAT